MALGFGKGGGKGKNKRMGQMGHGAPPQHCICPACGETLLHERGQPCFKRLCPQCGSAMTRQLVEEEP